MPLEFGDAAVNAASVLRAVEREEKRKASEGLISVALDCVYRSDESALKHVKQLAQAGSSGGELQDAVQQYEKTADRQSLVNEFALGALTAAPLMMRGPLAYLGAAGVEALEAMNLTNTRSQNLGAGFGGAMRGGIRKCFTDVVLSHNSWNFATKGAVLGTMMYAVDDLLSDRNMSLPRSQGQMNTVGWLTGAAVAAGTGAAFGSFNALLGNAIGGNPYHAMIATSAIGGFAVGATREFVKEMGSTNSVDPLRVLEHGLANGAGFAVGAIPGAHQWAAKQQKWDAYQKGSRFEVKEVNFTPQERDAALELQRTQDNLRATDLSGKHVKDINLFDTSQYPQSKEYQNIGEVFRGQEIEGGGFKVKLPNGEVVKGGHGDLAVLDKAGNVIGVRTSGYLSQYYESLGNGIYRETDYWKPGTQIMRAVPMSSPPEGQIYTEGNQPFNAKPGDWLMQNAKGVTWGEPQSTFHKFYWEIEPRSAMGAAIGTRGFPTDQAVDTYLKTQKIK